MPDLVTLETVRAFCRFPDSETESDEALEELITLVSDHLFETYEHEWAPAGSSPEARVFTYRGGGILDLAPCNAQAGTITAVSITPDGGSASDLATTAWEEMPARSKWGVTNYLRLGPAWRRNCVQTAHVTAKWGYLAVPTTVEKAACFTVKHNYLKWYGNRPSSFQDTEDEDGGVRSDVVIPQMARWLLRAFERTVVV